MADLKSPSQLSPAPSKQEENTVSARRQKKREIDRRCQRQARERTKSRIAYLESLVDNLRKSDTDERSAALMRRLHQTEKERDALGHTLKEIQRALGVLDPPIKLEPGFDEPADAVRDSLEADAGVDDFPSPDQYPSTTIDPPTLSHNTVSQPAINAYSEPPAMLSNVPDVAEERPRICNDICECCRESRRDLTGQPKNLWRYANNVLVEPYQAHSPITQEEDLLAEDMPIRIVLEGWDAVEQQFGLPVSWKFLRGIDQNLFAQCAPIERLAVLRYMHLLLQYHRDPTLERRAKLPPWFLARPSQTIPHSYAINYFVWPGLRERFIFQQHKYCSNLFWQLFAESLTMAWPYDFRDCFAQRWDTGVYELTPLFQDCLSDISRWTMRQDMFMKFPDLRCDIPASTMSPRPVSNQLQFQMAQVKTSTRRSASSGKTTTTRDNESSKQQQSISMESWNTAIPAWMESNPMFMASQPMATPWIS